MKIIDVFGGMTNTIRGTFLNSRLGPIRDPYPDGDLLQHSILKWIFEMVEKAGSNLIIAPDPIKENGVIMEPDSDEFDQLITIPESKVACRRGMDKAYADGVILPPLSAFFMFPADCVLINVVDMASQKVVASHGPREALRKNLVEAIMKKFSDSKKKDLRVMVCFGIQPENFDHPFDHPRFGDHNREMIEEIFNKWPRAIVGDKTKGKIWLHMLAAEQFIAHGVSAKNIYFDNLDTYSARRPNGEYAQWSARRDTKEREVRQRLGPWAPLETPPNQRPRNLVISVNRGEFSPKWDWRTVPDIQPVSEILKAR